jgi:phospholipase C
LHRPLPALFRSACASLVVALTACNSSVTAPPVVLPTPDSSVSSLKSKVNNIVVIYLENWTFDGLFSKFPGANGATTTSQVYCNNGTTAYTALTALPSAYQSAPSANGCTWNASQTGTVVDPKIASNGLSATSQYALENYVTPSYVTGDIIHRFWHEQLQIDNGVLEPPALAPYSNDKFVTWSDNQGLVMSSFDSTNLPTGQLAQQYVLADNFFHSAYGGSFLNHQWLICACTPPYNGSNPPMSAISTWNSTTKTLNDGALSYLPITNTSGQLYAINTIQPVYAPTGGGTELPLLTNKTIGDLLTDASPSIAWKWYAGGWTNALQSGVVYSAPDQFQPHHQPFNYYQRWGTGGTTAGSHLADESQFYTDLTAGTLPAVSFVKPVGVNNEHPGYSDLIDGENHVAALVKAVQNSKYWTNSIIIITYDEHGGRWDHVAPPPTTDGWGPGVRVPALIISPYAKKHFVDHTLNETVSILKLIETRFGLPNLTSRDAAANNMLEAFDFNQYPAPASSSKSTTNSIKSSGSKI